MTERIVERYLNAIEHELTGLDANEKATIIIELESHIMDKANAVAESKGLKKPTNDIYEKVIQKMGEPDKIGKDYLNVSMRDQSTEKINPFVRGDGEQKMICFSGIIIIAIGIFLTLIKTTWDNYSTHPYVPLSLGVIVLGVIITAYAWWIYPSKHKIHTQTDGKRKMIRFIGMLMIIIGSFLTLYRTPDKPGVHGSFPFIPWSLGVILLGILIFACVHWIYQPLEN